MSDLVLASTSSYRRELLARLGLPFVTVAPAADETRRKNEEPSALVARLAEAKARSVAQRHTDSLIIGSDQVALLGGAVLGKPGDFETNVAQLLSASGRRVEFLTGLCLLNSSTDVVQVDVSSFVVVFRSLTREQIEHYVRREQPFDCAGGFKSEGLGITLFDRMMGDDPTALIGLPLMRLVAMLEAEGLDALSG